MSSTSKFLKFLFSPILKPTMNYIRVFMLLMILSLGWNTLSAGMRVVKAMDQRMANQLEYLAQ
jgi:hypothetical protein